MRRRDIIKFVSEHEKIYICGSEGREIDAVRWYFDTNKIDYEWCNRQTIIIPEKRTGVFVIESASDIAEYKEKIPADLDVFYLKPFSTKELRCMYIISTKNDMIEAQMLVDAVASDSLTSDIINKCSYAGLMYIKNFYPEEIYLRVFNVVCLINKKRIDSQKKVKVGFLAKHSSEWSAESIYKHLLEDTQYECYIYVAPYYVGTETAIMDNYNNTLRYFKDNGYNVIEMYNQQEDAFIQWNDDNKCDYMFNLSANFLSLRKTSCIIKFPLSTLNIYIPYGFYLSGFVDVQFNCLSHAMFWKIFCESKMHKMMAGDVADFGNDNVEFSGYLKMDTYYNDTAVEENIWSIPKGLKTENIKKIIYAPHWSVGNASTAYGNFDKMYEKIYEYVKETRNTISWIIKPHPRLRSECVVQGVFESEAAYDSYLKKWDELDNARAVVGGAYDDIFKTSDGMILDSISFMAEYLYVHKPMIFLTKESQTTNKFGEEIMKVLYTVDGENFAEIKRYINQILLRNMDPKKEERESFFEQHLDYLKINGMKACDYIMNFL